MSEPSVPYTTLIPEPAAESGLLRCRKSRYAGEFFGQIPRLLNLLDREPFSPTYGSFDRDRWAWGSKDFDNADLQRGVLPLTIAYLSEWEGNRYHRNRRVLEWIEAGLLYWTKIQRADGSFDQWYPGEASAGTTGFTLGPILKSCALLGSELGEESREKILAAAVRAGEFLLRHKEKHAFISNHLAGTACSLRFLGEETGDKRFIGRSGAIIAEIGRRQSFEGWFAEYRGADPGYETLGLSYLADYYRQSEDPQVLEMARRSIQFLLAIGHPDGTVGGEYGSRNTELYFPAGLEKLAPALSEAEQAAAFFIQGLEQGVPSPSSADGPNFIPLLENYAQAFRETPPRKPAVSRLAPAARSVDFSDAKIAIRRNGRCHAIVGTGKGGVLKVFDPNKRRLIYSDCGYFGLLRNGRVISSQSSFSSEEISLRTDRIVIRARFHEVPTDPMTPARLIGLRLFSLSLGRLRPLSDWLKRSLVRRLITQSRPVPITLERKISFEENGVRVDDVLHFEKKFPVTRLARCSKARTIFMGSSRYMLRRDLRLEETREVPLPVSCSAGTRIFLREDVPAGGLE